MVVHPTASLAGLVLRPLPSAAAPQM